MADRHRGDVLAQRFALIPYGRLLLCNALVAGPQGVHNVVLLVDSGSNHTVLSVEALEKIGCSPADSHDHIRIMTANGVVILPRVRVDALTVFERKLDGAELIAHDLPFSGPIDGLLGMDVLTALGARIDIPARQIELG
jgi:predicted aspartyl protease